VVVIDADDGARHTVVLRDIGVRVGEQVAVEGRLARHKSGELQVAAETCERSLPSSIEGIEAFLASGVIRGVGPKLAHEIVAVFGVDTIAVLDSDPERLAEVSGVGRKRVAEIKRTWSRSRAIRSVLIFLRSNGISGAFTKRIYDTYGARAVRVIEENPYRLARDVRGIGFAKADAIAAARGITGDDPRRVRAGIAFALETALANGHVLRPVAALVVEASELLAVDDATVRSLIEVMTVAEELVPDPTETEPASVYLPGSAAAEEGLAQSLSQLIGAASRLGRPTDSDLRSISRKLSFDLDPGQASALKRVLGRSIGVLTGGPGTGKTTIVRAAVAFAKLRGMSLRLAAPTGRAAKRLSQATSVDASTVHRLLGFDPRSGEFRYNGETPIDADLIIVDEASMLDQSLALALVSAVRPGTSLLLVGDANQLPSVGAGNVLGDVISSDRVPVAILERVFRQAGDSEIVKCAHAVLGGESPVPSRAADGEFFFVESRSPVHAVERVVHLVRDRMPAAFGLSPLSDIQCLTPMNGGAMGTRALNEALQTALSPGGSHVSNGDRRLHVGDKVMQVRNNYDLEVYNGDIGIVSKVDPTAISVVVSFEGRSVEYSGATLDDLTLAYAITVHKSQGSEFRSVVLVLTNHHFKLLQRNLLYTAITRARERLVIVGDRRALQMAIDDLSGARRETRLRQRLEQLV
jgi:exodeoxyribonuclease V alpha subunit